MSFILNEIYSQNFVRKDRFRDIFLSLPEDYERKE